MRIAGRQRRGGGLCELVIGLDASERAVDGVRGAVVIQALKPALGRASEELAARDAQPFGRVVDAAKRVVRN